MKQLTLLFAILTASLSAGCAKKFSSGVDPTKKGSELSPAEVTQLCEAGAGYQYDVLVANQTDLCNLQGIGQVATAALLGSVTTDAQAQETCVTASEECLAQEVPTKEAAVADTCDGVDSAPNCQSLVGDIETCAQDASAARLDLARTAPRCDVVTLGDLAKLSPKVPDSCSGVVSNCPEASAIIL